MESTQQQYKSEIDSLSDAEKSKSKTRKMIDKHKNIPNNVTLINNDLAALKEAYEKNNPLDLFLTINFHHKGKISSEESLKTELFSLWGKKIYPHIYFYSGAHEQGKKIETIMESYKTAGNTCPKDLFTDRLHYYD
ncbi:hypothetical protein IPH67_04645 [bacterium]|nr:MAG: hypothetical protein IPH67_04645 [bacterium]